MRIYEVAQTDECRHFFTYRSLDLLESRFFIGEDERRDQSSKLGWDEGLRKKMPPFIEYERPSSKPGHKQYFDSRTGEIHCRCQFNAIHEGHVEIR